MRNGIAIIGAGQVGRSLALGLARVGESVVLGVRDLGASRQDLPTDVAASSIADASAGSSVVVLAVPPEALSSVLDAVDPTAGQIIVDATNAVRGPVPGGFDTVAAYVASLVPEGVSVVKAFNTIGAEHLNDGRFGDQQAFLPIAGDSAGCDVVEPIATRLGFEVAVLGDRDAFGLVEDFARLWIHLAFRCGWGRDFGFVAAQR